MNKIQRKIDIDKVIREIEEKSLYIYTDTKVIYEKDAIKIIKDNIKESEEINYSCHWNKKYNDLLRKYLKLSDKYFNLKDGKDDKLVYKYKD